MLHRLSRAFALAGALPLILLSMLSVGYEVPHFFNPCFTFGETGGLHRISPSCGGRGGGTSETMLGTIVQLTRFLRNCLVSENPITFVKAPIDSEESHGQLFRIL